MTPSFVSRPRTRVSGSTRTPRARSVGPSRRQSSSTGRAAPDRCRADRRRRRAASVPEVRGQLRTAPPVRGSCGVDRSSATATGPADVGRARRPVVVLGGSRAWSPPRWWSPRSSVVVGGRPTVVVASVVGSLGRRRRLCRVVASVVVASVVGASTVVVGGRRSSSAARSSSSGASVGGRRAVDRRRHVEERRRTRSRSALHRSPASARPAGRPTPAGRGTPVPGREPASSPRPQSTPASPTSTCDRRPTVVGRSGPSPRRRRPARSRTPGTPAVAGAARRPTRCPASTTPTSSAHGAGEALRLGVERRSPRPAVSARPDIAANRSSEGTSGAVGSADRREPAASWA